MFFKYYKLMKINPSKCILGASFGLHPKRVECLSICWIMNLKACYLKYILCKVLITKFVRLIFLDSNRRGNGWSIKLLPSTMGDGIHMSCKCCQAHTCNPSWTSFMNPCFDLRPYTSAQSSLNPSMGHKHAYSVIK